MKKIFEFFKNLFKKKSEIEEKPYNFCAHCGSLDCKGCSMKDTK